MKIYHHNDADGSCAAAIILSKHGMDSGIKVYPMNYEEEVRVDKINMGEKVYVVDFSFKPEVMREVMNRTKEVVWIDHHVTCKDYDYQYLKGLRDFRYKGLSGSELTWKFFYSEQEIPRGIRLVGDYDAWRLEEEGVYEFHEGMKLQNINPRSEIWEILIRGDGESEKKIAEVIRDGGVCIRYRDNYCKSMVEGFGYIAIIPRYPDKKCYATNIYRFGSSGFGDKICDYDICISYVDNGKEYIVSLYSEKEDIDVSEIAKSYGGGGHRGAAGFHCKELPFKRIC